MIGGVVAKTAYTAREAVQLVEVVYEQIESPIVSIQVGV